MRTWIWIPLLLLAGCTSVPPDAGFGELQQAAQQRLKQPLQRDDAARAAAAPLLARLASEPLGIDAAVQIALLNNRGLQAQLQELDITATEVLQAGRLPNPGFSFARLRDGSEVEYERKWHLDVARLIAMPLVARIEEQRLVETRGRALLATLQLAADVRKAWVQAVAAGETRRYALQVMLAAEASAELARRMAQAGNFNKLQRAREQGFYADAALGVARAEQAERAARERLIRLLGLWGEHTAFKLPERLPELPAQPRDEPEIETRAMSERLDVIGERLAVEQTARQLGLTKTTRFINVLELGYERTSNNEGHRKRGWEVSVEVPLFDWGGARIARAEAVYMQAVHRAAETAVNARSEVREAYGAYRSAWDIAHHHFTELVPLSRQIADENLLRYNGMLIGVFELLADARAQIAGVNAAIEALRDFWLAQADLEMALIGKPTLAAAAASALPTGAEPAGKAPH